MNSNSPKYVLGFAAAGASVGRAEGALEDLRREEALHGAARRAEARVRLDEAEEEVAEHVHGLVRGDEEVVEHAGPVLLADRVAAVARRRPEEALERDEVREERLAESENTTDAATVKSLSMSSRKKVS